VSFLGFGLPNFFSVPGSRLGPHYREAPASLPSGRDKLAQRLQFAIRASFIHIHQGLGFKLEQPYELRGRSAQLVSALPHIKTKHEKTIQSLRKQAWEIFMTKCNANSLRAKPRTPERAGTTTTSSFQVRSHLNRQFDSKSMNGHLLVSGLTALFRRLAANTGGLMNQDHSRLHLITMLTSGPATSLTPDNALGKQFFGR
jgi:hypothetical protein